MHAGYLVAMIVAVCDDLAVGAEWLARDWWTRMALCFNGLEQVAVLGALPILAVIEELPKSSYQELPKSSYRDFADARVGSHELVGF